MRKEYEHTSAKTPAARMPPTKASMEVLSTPADLVGRAQVTPPCRTDGDLDISEPNVPGGPVALTVSEADDVNPHADQPEPKTYQQARKGNNGGGRTKFHFVPDGLVITKEELKALEADIVDKVELLHGQSLYELKQTGRPWYEHLHRLLVKLGFSQCVMDACL
ncbi:Reverse transcriptase, RNA-dependent DNA polymerase [Plasmopara halstedii]|uniref:Reverse transcriptase, RNA-dependent DNA polymerase n=1 Tax=Plasmopara halstedii TaxID=4781 RepID=A0A0P1A7A5_PLAHL|nr:Reverse transcriptase, RNA-dependent DNA polymerase [Plasmopara halstedii]CEG35984.1 Reverse transcriptase, RNA-dependent DNA polymerase [Plasmopara halstedii]|eukprot:XP_024572353.1 Reverse transcriptase, RNA-dependent DNA polymerase [Plasmopara halstedii]